MTDQATFSASCTANQASGPRADGQPVRRHANQAAIAIRKYSTVHTGPKIQSGGFQLGFSSVWYQPFTETAVAALPIPAAANVAATRPMSQRACDVFV